MTSKLKTITDQNFQLISPDKLKPNESNARQHGEEQIMLIAESMQEFGQVMPILVDKGLRIIAGHARWEAARKIDLRSVAIIRIDHLAEEQFRLYTIAELRELLEIHAPALVEKAAQMALAGDTTALKLCLDRIIPVVRSVEMDHTISDQPVIFTPNMGKKLKAD